MTRAGRAPFLALALWGTAAGATERYDHKGAVALWLAGGGGFRTGLNLQRQLDGGARFPVDLSAFVALPDTQNGLWAGGRASLGGGRPEWSVRGGYRGFFGLDCWKTFFDVGAAFPITPRFAAALRAGAGAQFELAPTAGLFLAGGAEIGGGNGFHFAADVTLGIELRTYWLE